MACLLVTAQPAIKGGLQFLVLEKPQPAARDQVAMQCLKIHRQHLHGTTQLLERDA
jgi:hypothetical protein